MNVAHSLAEPVGRALVLAVGTAVSGFLGQLGRRCGELWAGIAPSPPHPLHAPPPTPSSTARAAGGALVAKLDKSLFLAFLLLRVWGGAGRTHAALPRAPCVSRVEGQTRVMLSFLPPLTQRRAAGHSFTLQWEAPHGVRHGTSCAHSSVMARDPMRPDRDVSAWEM